MQSFRRIHTALALAAAMCFASFGAVASDALITVSYLVASDSYPVESVKLTAQLVAQADEQVAGSLRSDLRKDGHGYRLASADEYGLAGSPVHRTV